MDLKNSEKRATKTKLKVSHGLTSKGSMKLQQPILVLGTQTGQSMSGKPRNKLLCVGPNAFQQPMPLEKQNIHMPRSGSSQFYHTQGLTQSRPDPKELKLQKP